MKGANVLALIMAGGEGKRLELLTDERAKPAIPFAGVYRLIDFPLSNCMHSGISDVWIVQQFQPHSLEDHVSNGRPWDLDRTHGGLRLLHPHTGTREGGWHQGNADAIYRNRTLIRQQEPDVLLVLSSDHVYKLDYTKALDHHRARGADVTMVTTSASRDDASRLGTVEASDDGRVTRFEYKPDSPASHIVTTEVFLFDAPKLLATLEKVAEGNERGEEGLEDFGDELLPQLVKDGNAHEYRLEGYWRDVGTVDSYWSSHMDLLEEHPQLDLDDPAWPILTRGVQRPPARIFASARNENSLVSPGCVVRGRVEHSILGPGVIVEDGALVRDSVVLDGAIIGANASLHGAIVDMGARVGDDARVGEPREAGRRGAEDIALVGPRAEVTGGARVPAGGRVKRAD